MAEAYFLRLAGAEPAPKRMVRESCVALSSARMTRGAEPAPKRTRRESAIFLEGLRTTGFLDMDISPRSFCALRMQRATHWRKNTPSSSNGLGRRTMKG